MLPLLVSCHFDVVLHVTLEVTSTRVTEAPCCHVEQELRRGADPARIFSVAFSRGPIPEYVAVSSDKGTVHVFTLDAKRTEAIPTTEETSSGTDANNHRNPVSAFSFVSVSLLTAAALGESGFAELSLQEPSCFASWARWFAVCEGSQDCSLLVIACRLELCSIAFHLPHHFRIQLSTKCSHMTVYMPMASC